MMRRLNAPFDAPVFSQPFGSTRPLTENINSTTVVPPPGPTRGFPTAGALSLNIATAGSFYAKVGSGILFSITINTGQTGASLTLYDGTSAQGNKLGTFSAAAGTPSIVFPVGLAFRFGLFAVTAGATPADITLSFF